MRTETEIKNKIQEIKAEIAVLQKKEQDLKTLEKTTRTSIIHINTEITLVLNKITLLEQTIKLLEWTLNEPETLIEFQTNFLNGLDADSFTFHFNYPSLDHCREIVAITLLMSTKDRDKLKPVTLSNGIYFQIDDRLIVDVKIIKESEDKYVMYSLNLSAFNEYEKKFYQSRFYQSL